MLLNFMKAKIHRLRVTQANHEYEGSVTIDELLMKEAGILPYEQVQVYDVTSGSRFVTYAMEGPPGKGDCCVNGAAARLVALGDEVIIMSYCLLTQEEALDYQPKVVLMNKDNSIKDSFTVRGGHKEVGAPLVERK